jgi:hypothetical protein
VCNPAPTSDTKLFKHVKTVSQYEVLIVAEPDKVQKSAPVMMDLDASCPVHISVDNLI